DDPTASACVLS
nr:Chain P, farnesylated peptide [synthetic construct]2H6G_P Chain P, farnesylated peptide [synthetic construct]2H6H_P Chain P, farnesylated peptide [synthetic construct]2H6I_P Chain P, farnesylated peptide [synthetic construct]